MSTSLTVHAWEAATPMYIAHRGGDADWPEATAYAYAQAAVRNPSLALEVSLWRTSDGVWVISDAATTGRVFGTNDVIAQSTWAQLSMLRTRKGGYPMARFVNDVLGPYGSSRIIFVDDKSDTNGPALLALLGTFGGKSRFVIKSYWHSPATALLAQAAGYDTWGYYYSKDLAHFAATQSKFTLLGLEYTATAADFATLRATGKPIIAHTIATADQARVALTAGAAGLMVSGVTEVVPKG